MHDIALNKLQESINEKNLNADSAKTLYEISIDPHGVEQSAAPGLVASLLYISMERANQSLIELIGKDLLTLKETDNDTRIYPNYNKLDIDEETKCELLAKQEVFENMREAHSHSSINSLDDFFLQNDDTIYIGCEVTSHHTFRKLSERASNNKQTVFIIPRKKHVSKSRHIHYDEVLNGWIKFIKDGPSELKKNIRIRLTNHSFPQLYTSSLSISKARFNLYFLNDKTTRRGSLLQVKKGTSLYELIFQNYQDALSNSYPIWRLWPLDAAKYWSIKIVLPVSLIATGVFLSKLNNPVSITLSAIAVGLVVNILWSNFGKKTWSTIKLYKK
jgi:hypothetical protein